MLNGNIELLQWLYVAIIAPLLGALGGWVHSWWVARVKAKRRKDRFIKALSGLPPESKAILIDFHNHGAHTLRADPFDPPIRLLIKSGYMERASRGGTHNAIDSYLTIHPDIWEVMDDWLLADAASVAFVREEFFKPSKHE
ncbi:MAG: super-infection exclusion protein B [Candidatus Thiodiazotropha sp.]